MSKRIYHMTVRSANVKTGPIPVSTSGRATCPSACPLRGSGGCYAEDGKLRLHWDRVDRGAYERSLSLPELCRAVQALPADQLWRHNQAGDLPGRGNRVDTRGLRLLTKANQGRRGYTYTHKPVLAGTAPEATANLRAVRAAVAGGFAVNLSANNLEEADRLRLLGLPIVAIVPEDAPVHLRTPAGAPVVVCPAQLRDGVTCATCGLCAVTSAKRPIVGFRAHGNKRRALTLALNVH